SPAVPLGKAKARMAAGMNVGVRLRDIDLVVDVDPRHFVPNDDPLVRLSIDFGLPDAPFVLTGGGGRHVYFTKPASVELAGKLVGYDGIDFKSKGGQVVAAGSIHPDTGKPYRLDDDALAMLLSEAPEAPTALLDALGKHSAVASADVGAIDEEKLAEWLSRVDVSAFREELRWRELMMACHHATGGAGIDAFVDWSTADPDFTHHGEIIRRRWNSLDMKRGAITARTLVAALPKEMRREATELLNRADAEDDFPDDEGELAKSKRSFAVGDDWVWAADAERFLRRSDTKKFAKEQWKSLFAGLKLDGDVLNAIWKGNLPMRKFESLVYLPEMSEFPDGESGGRYNLWRKSGVLAVEGDVSVFLDHMAHLFPDERERGHVLDYLALLVQRPAEKIHFALMIRGMQGTGKSWLGNLMERVIGARNTVRPSNDEVTSRWTAWMEGAQLAIIEELMTLGRREVANRLKPAITDPTLRIEEKNCRIYSIPNCLNFLCFTNHEDALPIEHGDRRWLVVFSPAAKKDAAYYERLFGYLDGGGAAFVKHWLLQRDVALNGHGVAPATSGKETMRRLSMGDAEAYLLDLYEAGEEPFEFDLVRVDDLVNAVPAKLAGRSSLRARLAKLLKEEFGGVAHTRHTKQHPNRPPWQLWSLRNHDVWENIGASGRIDAYMAHYSIDLMPRPERRSR
ncbi:DUF5906 domain-containing protein, partial [Xanthobacter sp. V0B-10]|uniref:DUF5906 domain-containing protein n=1 Tax=Xanthobacter albus TaxID=3119929 RepID=UPI00372C5432